MIEFLSIEQISNPLNGGDLRYWHLANGGQGINHFQNPKEGSLNWIKEVHDKDLKTKVSSSNSIRLTEGTTHIVVCDHRILDWAPKAQGYVFDPTDSHSFYYLRRWRTLPLGLKKLNGLRLFLHYRWREAQISKQAKAIIVSSEIDANYLRCFVNCPVHAIGIGSTFCDYPPRSEYLLKSKIGFHGGMSWPPNVAAANYLIHEIYPLLINSLPWVVMDIVGGPVPETFHAITEKRIRILGSIPSVADWMESIDIYVMPMQQGAGVKTKLVEAMAKGLPIVTNNMGAEALNDEGKRCVVIANGSHEVVQAIKMLLTDERKRESLGKRARAYALANFSWSNYSNAYMAIVEGK